MTALNFGLSPASGLVSGRRGQIRHPLPIPHLKNDGFTSMWMKTSIGLGPKNQLARADVPSALLAVQMRTTRVGD